MSLDLSKCQLNMPRLSCSQPFEREIPPLTDCQPLPYTMRVPAAYSRHVDMTKQGEMTVRISKTTGEKKYLEHGLAIEWISEETESISENDPTSARLKTLQKVLW